MGVKQRTAQESLDALLLDVRDGKTVDPLDIMAARERVQMVELAALGAAARALTERAEAQRHAAEALEKPLAAELKPYLAKVQTARLAASKALHALLAANEAYTAEAMAAAGTLETAGRANGSVHTTNENGIPEIAIGPDRFEYVSNTEEVIALMHVLTTSYPMRTAWHRDFLRGLPVPLQGGPQRHLLDDKGHALL